VYEHLILKPFPIGYKVRLQHGERIGIYVTYETHVMLQEDNENILDNNPMCHMVNDAFGYHQHRNDKVDDRKISV